MASEKCILTCFHCKNKYDMAKLSLEVQNKRQKNIYCPNCGKKVGTLQ